LLDAMRDGSSEGMQCFDDEIEKLIRNNELDMETGLAYATNEGNLRLMLADLLEPQAAEPSVVTKEPAGTSEVTHTEEVVER
jgi:Tfp pilus assembly ATPase PilU